MGWCVTDRMGMYIYQYAENEGVPDDRVNQSLIRVGRVHAVTWSGVFSYQGQPTTVFKIGVKIGEGDGGGLGPAESKWYVVKETAFMDFSVPSWRDTAMDPREDVTICTNVCDTLKAAYATFTRTPSTGGKWFKNWFMNQTGGTENTPLVPPPLPPPPAMPTVFGAPPGAPLPHAAAGQQPALNLSNLPLPDMAGLTMEQLRELIANMAARNTSNS